MAHALAAFINERMNQRGLRNRDLVAASGLSRALVSKYVTDSRETLSRLPAKETLDGLAKGLGVSTEFLLGKAIESLGLGYTSGDFVNRVDAASDDELLYEIEARLRQRSEKAQTVGRGLRRVDPDHDEQRAAHEDETSIEDEQGHPEDA